jgi:uncharacterized protein (UPF0548 family)
MKPAPTAVASPVRPRFSLTRPSTAAVSAFRTVNERAAFSYTALGESASGRPSGYTVDHNRIQLGSGEALWTCACAALENWRMFPRPWAALEPVEQPINVGSTFIMIAHAYGLWWMNGCRIVYRLDERLSDRQRHGFAYGTLTSHVEEGEERFMIERLADDSVWYDLRAFSRPRYWPVRLFHPLARRLQKRFVRESLTLMQRESATR